MEKEESSALQNLNETSPNDEEQLKDHGGKLKVEEEINLVGTGLNGAQDRGREEKAGEDEDTNLEGTGSNDGRELLDHEQIKEIYEVDEEDHEEKDHNVVEFLDSVDCYLTLLESLSSNLRQGWLQLASARHSMGASRINSGLFDLKYHNAATKLHVTLDGVEPATLQPSFTLSKWISPSLPKDFEGVDFDENEWLQMKSADDSHLRYRGTSEIEEKMPEDDVWTPRTPKTPRTPRTPKTPRAENHIQKQRSKSLSVFGTLVSPKLRATQFSFETALETLIELANMRSKMLSSFDVVRNEIDSTRGC